MRTATATTTGGVTAADRFAAVTQVLADYFDGLYHSDVARLRRAFHPRAQYVCATTGALQCLAMDEYLPIVERRPSPASRAEARTDFIRSIDFAGVSAAVARVRCRIGERHFDDILSLVLVDGRWQIIAKVFDYATTIPAENERCLS